MPIVRISIVEGRDEASVKRCVEVAMKQAMTPLLAAAQAKGCAIQVGTDMLFEMIPAYLEFFGFGTATPGELRAVSQIKY